MRLGIATNGRSCEYKMQEVFKLWLNKKGLSFKDELRVPEVHRIADFVVLKPGKGLINVEAKCNDFDCMLKQLKDHATYCNYSFAYIPDFCRTPKWFKKQLMELGYGLLIYNWDHKIITEVLEAHQNKITNDELRARVIKKIRA